MTVWLLLAWCLKLLCRLGVGDLAGPNLPVHMEGVVCNGTERSLGDCRFNVVTDSVFHGSDVYIVCLPGPENYSGKAQGVGPRG